MGLLSRPHGKSLPSILVTAILISTSPMFAGCSRSEEPQATPSPTATPEPSPVAAPEQSAAATPAAAAPTTNENTAPGAAPGAATAQELQQLVSPIALYPDLLVAQILAGSTYPTQVVEAARWIKENPNLTGDALAAQVNPQPWDPSIKSLTQFPSVLQTMNDNLAWTSSLGEAYYNQPGDVMNAIQVMRNKAVAAGNLKSTAQQKVELQPAPPAEQGSAQPSVQQTVIIQPAQPNTVYVPQYNPTTAYGAPVPAPAGYSGTDMLLTGVLAFGAGILVGSLINDGHNNWGCNWGGGYNSSVVYNRNVYVSNNNVYPGRYPAGGYPAGGYPRPGYPGYRPPNGGGAYPRPAPYPGGRPPYNGGGGYRPNNPAIPSTRPYNPERAKGNNPNFKAPKFPSASTLPNGGRENLNGKGLAQNQGNRRENPGQSTRPSTRPATNMSANRPSDPARGFAKTNNPTGRRNGALGGYEPGGAAQASRERGQASFGGNRGGGGGNRGGSGGGNAFRGGGGGGGNRGGGGGGGNRGGGRRGR
jgi:hypothetical protein